MTTANPPTSDAREQVTGYEQTCEACPSQWDAVLASGKRAYIRYRWGVLTVTLYEGQLTFDAPDALVVEAGDDLAGYMDDDTMRQLTADVLDWGNT